MRTRSIALSALVLGILAVAPALPALGAQPQFIISISVDGLRPDAITNLGAANLPNFYKFRTEGAFTDNARTDYDITVTLPNHVTQITGRGIQGATGHNWTLNSDPAVGQTIQSNKGSYVYSVLDVAHDNGLHTGLYAGKSKFSLFDASYGPTYGNPNPTYGADKIDKYLYNGNSTTLVNQLIADENTSPYQYAFLHLADPDATGHSSGWDPTPGSAYSNTIKSMDTLIGLIFGKVTTDSRFIGKTTILLTADHGGQGTDHSDPTIVADYTIPFYAWGVGVTAGADLYALNPPNIRLDPGTGRPQYSAPVQPIRNGEVGNVALALLGLSAIPGSTLDNPQTLVLPEPATMALLAFGGFLAAMRRRRR